MLLNEYLRSHRIVVDADVVEKTGAAGPGLHRFAGVNIGVVACFEQTDKVMRLPAIVSSSTHNHQSFLQGLHKRNKVFFLLLGELGSKYQVEKLHRVIQSKESPIM